MIGLAITALVALGLFGIGIGALVAPRASSAQYGIVLDDARALAFIRAMGARDLVIGLLLLLLACGERRDLLALGMVASSVIAVVDLAVVSLDRPSGIAPRAPAFTRSRVLHALGAIGLLVAGLVIATGR